MRPTLAALMLLVSAAPGMETKPNVVLIYADDIGYGDLSCYGATKVQTPNCDRLAAAGLRFTDAHTVASVCTPSRYSLLSGEYAFRKKGTGIASGIDGMLLDPARTTLPSMMKSAGYTTAVIGKWHLGLGTAPTNYNQPIKPGPREVGFDSAWILPATGDRVPCVWVENDRVVNLDPADPIQLDYTIKRGSPASMVKGIPRIGGQQGGTAALWDDEEMSTVIAKKSCEFIAAQQQQPFFLFMATHNIHVPRVPNPKFKGKSDCGVRGDAIVEFDWMVGQILDQLEKLGLADKTLVILSSDNGGINDDNGPDKVHGCGDPDATNGHRPNGPLRGTKGTVWEGGTRVPFIVRWPGKVQPGTSDALFSQIDMLASLAALVGQQIPADHAPDSENHLPALLGTAQDGREYLLSQGNTGAPFGLRFGHWKLAPNAGRGKSAGPAKALFNLANDLGETQNVAAAHPDIVAKMTAKLQQITGQVPKAVSSADQKPNILLIVSDDHGYADVGFQGCQDIPTPHLDQLARSGLHCTSGYVSHPFCSPTRAGLMTGRYQQRFGHENNVFYDPADHREGLPVSEKLLPAFLKDAGYVTGWIGKWHLGAAPEFRPLQRGFTETFGFIGGGHRYQNWKVNPAAEYQVPIERNGTPVEVTKHLTVAFGEESAAFVRRHQDAPWFLYLAFNAPHTPHEPTAERLAKFASIENPKRRQYAAQVSLMDDAIGETLAALLETAQDRRTLVFFFSDNGGPVGGNGNGSLNTPLRGGKGSLYEGGVRVPFVVSWPGHLPAGKTYAHPVCSLDVFATALATAGVPMPTDRKYDSVNLLPYLSGEQTGVTHERLFWRSGPQRAVLDGQDKLVCQGQQPSEFYQIASDLSEAKDLASEKPADAKHLAETLEAWNKELVPPAFPGLGGRQAAKPGKKAVPRPAAPAP